jgi:hypothetical protein
MVSTPLELLSNERVHCEITKMNGIPAWVLEEMKEQDIPIPSQDVLPIRFTRKQWEDFSDIERAVSYQLSAISLVPIEITSPTEKVKPIVLTSSMKMNKRPLEEIATAGEDEYKAKKMKQEIFEDMKELLQEMDVY